MDNKSYPAWAAVFLIPALFTYVTIRFAVQGKPVEKAWIIGGLAATVTLGAIIWLLDSPRRNKTETTEVDHWIALTPGNTAGFAVATHLTQIFADPGTEVNLTLFPTTNPATVSCNVAISGTLTPITPITPIK